MPRLLMFGALLMLAQVSTPQCDSSNSSGAINNTVPIVVNGGPENNAFNEPFVSVTVCVPGTSNCQTIDGILVDTGSEGLRLASNVLRVPLTQQTTTGGAAVVECLPFLDSVTWGPVMMADVKIAGEVASAIPVQVIGTDKFPAVPNSCSSQGALEETSVDLAANGILGIGHFDTDCGPACTQPGTANPGLYYACSGAACQITTQPLANQVVSPVARFATDNNGLVIQLPAVPVGGLPTVTGALVFGIGTQSNNGLGSARVFTVDASDNIRTTFNNQSYPAFIDSGSNGIFFLDTPTTGLPPCQMSTGFYCPPTIRAFSATTVGNNGASAVVSFNAGNVDALNATLSVMSEATGSNPGGFDWGLPFFYGRAVYVAIAGRSTPGGIGPYWAY